MLQSVGRWLFPSDHCNVRYDFVKISVLFGLFVCLFLCFHRSRQRQLPPQVGQLWGSWEPHLPWDARAQPQAPGGAEGEAFQGYAALQRPCASRWVLESAGVARYNQTGCSLPLTIAVKQWGRDQGASPFGHSPSSNTRALVGISKCPFYCFAGG